MLRIYLDLNILTKFKKNPALIELRELIKANRDDIIIFYSAAHIEDLIKSDNEEQVLSDLDEIKFWTHCHSLFKYWGHDYVSFEISDPFEHYKKAKDDPIRSFNLTYFENLIQGLNLEEASLENPLGKMKSLNHNINFSALDLNDEEQAWFYNNFPYARQNPSFYAFFKDCIHLLTSLQKDRENTRRLRKIIRKQIPFDLNRETNIFSFLNLNLPKTRLRKTFDDFRTGNNSPGDKKFERYDKFLSAYSSLDILGFNADKNSLLSNTTVDSLHSFYAAHCDVFITDDQKLRKKSEALYKEFNISTGVFSPLEYVSVHNDFISDCKTLSDILSECQKSIETGISSSNFAVSNENDLIEFECTPKILYFFNRLVISQKEGSFMYLLSNLSTNYSSCILFKEIEYVVNKLILILGSDSHNRGKFSNEESESISLNNWSGRLWYNEYSTISLQQSEWAIYFGIRMDY